MILKILINIWRFTYILDVLVFFYLVKKITKYVNDFFNARNIDIKFSEPLKIQMGDITKVINENVLASILLQNQNFVQSIITKIGIMDTGFGYHKDNANNPFPSQLYT